MAKKALRIGIAGATGLLGRELVAVLESDSLPVGSLELFASDRSLGEDVEFGGEGVAVNPLPDSLVGLDAIVVCTPIGAALDLVRAALRAEVPCIDCSGSLASSPEVPLALAGLGAHDGLASAPLISSPPGAALIWAPVLAAIQREVGVRRVVGSVLCSASSSGRAGIAGLSEETLALLNQRESEVEGESGGPHAFDCHAHGGPDDLDKEGRAPAEAQLASILQRLLGADLRIAATCVHVPTFAGQGATFAIETQRALSLERAAEIFEAAEGIDLWADGAAPSTRDAVGRDDVIVGRLRADSSLEPGHGLLLWAAGDPLRLAAINAARLLRARFPV
jgi:aspartate-semialdehyde dehydrogenase